MAVQYTMTQRIEIPLQDLLDAYTKLNGVNLAITDFQSKEYDPTKEAMVFTLKEKQITEGEIQKP